MDDVLGKNATFSRYFWKNCLFDHYVINISSFSIMIPVFGLLRVNRFQRTYGRSSTIIFDPGTNLRIARTFCARTEQLIPEQLILEELRLIYCIPLEKENRNEVVKFWRINKPSPNPVLNKKGLLVRLIMN